MVPRCEPRVGSVRQIAYDGAIAEVPGADAQIANDLRAEINFKPGRYVRKTYANRDRQGPRFIAGTKLIATYRRRVRPELSVNISAADVSRAPGTAAG